ncbi:MAG TPA: hypothetical protein VFB66_08745 [Tepidisphaeraceae bacterium]|nr:hypothetical protein [Tepidisphaeraceae bacterium]
MPQTLRAIVILARWGVGGALLLVMWFGANLPTSSGKGLGAAAGYPGRQRAPLWRSNYRLDRP